METPFVLLWTLVLSGLSATIATDDSGSSCHCKAAKEVYHMSGTITKHTHLSRDAEIKNSQSVHQTFIKEEILNNILGEIDSMISKYMKVGAKDHTLQEFAVIQDELKKENEIFQNNCTSYGNSNGVQNVKIPNLKTFPALCNSDIAGPGWTVIQQRINGKENFYRDWEDYKNGFGNFTDDFFLGLEKIHRLTNEKPHELYIYMEGFGESGIYKTNPFYARYDNFRIAGEDDKYRLLNLGEFSGTAATDKMRYSENQNFSTFDRDNSQHTGNCAKENGGAWWYNACGHCNLNGMYRHQEENDPHYNWWASHYSLKTVKMMIRPRDF